MKKTLLIFFFFCSFQLHAQHNSMYSQFMYSGLLINPAYAGSQDAMSLVSIYRNQWVNVEGAPKTFSINLHTPLKNKKVNLGISLLNDKIGVTAHTKVDLFYAYRIKMEDGFLSLGLQAGVDSYVSNWADIHTTQSLDPSFVSAPIKKTLPEAGTGIYYYTKKYFFGISAPTLYKQTGGNSFQYNPYMINAGILYKLKGDFILKPTLLIKYIKSSPVETDLALTLFWKNKLGVGMGYRTNDALTYFIDFRINDQFHFSYAYDYTISKLQNYTNGSHEIMLKYLFGYMENVRSPRYF